jgi:hypothetical protein
LWLLWSHALVSCTDIRSPNERSELADGAVDAGDGDSGDAARGDGDGDGDGDAGPDAGDGDARSSSADVKLVISEVDYDQPGTDTAELIEIYNAGLSATSLDGYELVLADGEEGEPYRVIDLSDLGTIEPRQYLVVGSSTVVNELGSGVLTIDLGSEPDAIQNAASVLMFGRGDAVFLLDRTRDVVIDRLAYEGAATIDIEGLGSKTAIEGEPTDGVDDDAYGSAGSLCRLPQGTDTDDAAHDWHTCTRPTPGAANVREPSVIINEVDSRQGSNEITEFIELANTGSSGMHLRGLYLVLVNQAGPYLTINLEPAGTIPAGGYAVIGPERLVEDLDASHAVIDVGATIGWILDEEPAGVALVDGITGTLLDAISYDGSVTAAMIPDVGVVSLVEGTVLSAVDTGAGITLCRVPDATDTNDAASDWAACTAPSVGYANVTP